MHWLDWLIVFVLLAFICITAYGTKKYMLSVADFLSANRCAGKYLLGVADGIAGLGAISIVARFEMGYKAGFTSTWWDQMLLPIGLLVSATGWVQYRFRQTRALTMAQFFEMRYNRSFRVFAGMLGFVSGIVNFGIFPAVGGRFFQHFCGLPEYLIPFFGFDIDLVYAGLMAFLLLISLAFTFMGGQIAVMVTDFFQGIFVNIVFVIIGIFLLFHFDWSQIMEAAAQAPADASLINPINTSATDNFNSTYFLIQAFATVYLFMAWQGNQGYYGSAKSPHDAKIGRVIGHLRPITQTLVLVLLPMCAWTFLNHIDFAQSSQQAQEILGGIDSEQIRSQLTVTVAVSQFLPVGILGLFAAVMLAAFISTHDTYLHAWGSIFIQDVVLPVRQHFSGPDQIISPAAHIKLLRAAIIGVCVFIFLFSLFFSQQQDILMFFALTGTIYLGWAGAAIIGGLYWKHGTTAGAWGAAMIGVTLAFGGWYFTYFWPDCQAMLSSWFPDLWASSAERWPGLRGDKAPINAQIPFFWTTMTTLSTYVVVSLISGLGKEPFNMDQLLHRGEFEIEKQAGPEVEVKRGWAIFGMGKEFSLGDRVVYVFSYSYIIVVSLLFVFGTIYMLSTDISDAAWGNFWWYFCLVMLVLMVLITVWVAVGGLRDLKELKETLSTLKRDAHDDGTVVGHRSLVDVQAGGE